MSLEYLLASARMLAATTPTTLAVTSKFVPIYRDLNLNVARYFIK